MRQNRGIGIVIAALLAGIVGGWLGGQVSRPPVAEAAGKNIQGVIRARGFELYDSKDRYVGAFEARNDEPSLSLRAAGDDLPRMLLTRDTIGMRDARDLRFSVTQTERLGTSIAVYRDDGSVQIVARSRP